MGADREDRRPALVGLITRRDEKIRLISARRSRDEEVAIYESEDF
jgi:uncharacterized DUF497 family protein